MHADHTDRARPRVGRRASVLMGTVALVVILAACNPLTTVGGWLGLNAGEVATPEFVIQNGIRIMAQVQAPSGLDGATVTVHLKCQGGSTLTQTVTLHTSGQFATGTTDFAQTGWEGIDCVLTQEQFGGVTIVQAILGMPAGVDGILSGSFFNQ